jgi:ribosomal-protein-alanine N-acetyltransferase
MEDYRIPHLTTTRLLLRCITPNDIPAYEKHFIDYEVIRHLASVVPWPYPKNGVSEFLHSQVFPRLGSDRWMWAITLKESPQELIGAVDLWREGIPEHRGFWLGRAYWGKGYMTEAVAPVTDYAFTSLGFEKLVFNNAVGNARSSRVKEKTGAKLIGRSPAKFVDPSYTEHETYELTLADWLAFKKASENKA